MRSAKPTNESKSKICRVTRRAKRDGRLKLTEGVHWIMENLLIL